MRQPYVLALTAALALPLTASADPPSTTRLSMSGFGAVAVIHQDDGNGHATEGYLFGVNVLHGARPDVPWSQAVVFFGTRWDEDLGGYVTYLGAGEATVSGQGLGGQHVTGSLEAQPFWDGSSLPPTPLAPITIDVDLQWTGQGSVYATVAHFAAGAAGSSYVFYEAQRWRYASVSGSASIDGAPAWVDTAQLLADTAGEYNLVAQP